MHMHEEPGAEEEAKEELRLNFRSPGISGRQDETEKSYHNLWRYSRLPRRESQVSSDRRAVTVWSLHIHNRAIEALRDQRP